MVLPPGIFGTNRDLLFRLVVGIGCPRSINRGPTPSRAA